MLSVDNMRFLVPCEVLGSEAHFTHDIISWSTNTHMYVQSEAALGIQYIPQYCNNTNGARTTIGKYSLLTQWTILYILALSTYSMPYGRHDLPSLMSTSLSYTMLAIYH